jgi:hypothetical protein
MTTLFSPLRLVGVALDRWMNRYQQAVIDYLVAESHLLKEQLDGRRLKLVDVTYIDAAATAHSRADGCRSEPLPTARCDPMSPRWRRLRQCRNSGSLETVPSLRVPAGCSR